jgi:methyl-galactoside transport system substrate-binding protein
MKVVKFTVLVVVAVLLLGCANGNQRVALFHYKGEDPYINVFVQQIEEKAAGMFELDTFDARNSQILQNEQIAGVLEDPPSLLIVNPVDRLGAYTIIRRLKEMDIPVIFFNREPLRRDLFLWEHTYYIGARAAQSARLQAQLVMELFGGEPERLNRHDTNGDGWIQTVILKGEQGHQDAEIRTTEVLRSFEEAGFLLDVMVIEVANWDRNEAYGKMEDLLREYGAEMELLISNNDAMALGAIVQMQQRGYFADSNGDGRIDKDDEEWIPVVGIDGIDDAVAQIEDGYLYGTVKNDSLSMAVAIVELAGAILNGNPLSTLSFPLEEDKYVWIDYQPFVLE